MHPPRTTYRLSIVGLVIWAYVVGIAVYGGRQALDGVYLDGVAAILAVLVLGRFARWIDTRPVEVSAWDD